MENWNHTVCKINWRFLTFQISQNRVPIPSILRRRSGKVGEDLIAQERKCNEIIFFCDYDNIGILRKMPKYGKFGLQGCFFQKVPKDFMLTVRRFSENVNSL